MKADNIKARNLVLTVDGKEIESSGLWLDVDLPHKESDGWPDRMMFELTLKNGKKIYYEGKRAKEKE